MLFLYLWLITDSFLWPGNNQFILIAMVFMYICSLFKGDDDPIDIVDLSSKERKILDIVNLKVLGAFCLIDEGELDWKVFTIDSQEAK